MPIDPTKACRYCGHFHGDLCPSVKAFSYAEDGATIIKVEFFSPVDRVHPELIEAAGRIVATSK